MAGNTAGGTTQPAPGDPSIEGTRRRALSLGLAIAESVVHRPIDDHGAQRAGLVIPRSDRVVIRREDHLVAAAVVGDGDPIVGEGIGKRAALPSKDARS